MTLHYEGTKREGGLALGLPLRLLLQTVAS